MSDMFPTVTGVRRGYDPGQVSDFFTEAREAYEGAVPADRFSYEQVRRSTFDLQRGGFDVTQVDAALARLENAFVQRDRAAYVAEHGEAAWFDKVADEATVLYPRLLRPAGERFSHPEDRGKGYDTAQVDALLDRIAAYFEDQDELTPEIIRSSLFKVARGDKAYVEAQVDAFLGKATHIMMAVS